MSSNLQHARHHKSAKLEWRMRHYLLTILALLNLFALLVIPQAFEAILLLDVAAVVAWMAGLSLACPKCHEFYSRELKSTSFLGTHALHHRPSVKVQESNADFMLTRKVTENPVIMRRVQNNYVCKKCAHAWSGKIHDVPR